MAATLEPSGPLPLSHQTWDNSSSDTNTQIFTTKDQQPPSTSISLYPPHPVLPNDTSNASLQPATSTRPPVSEQIHPIRQKLGLNPRAPIHEDHDNIPHNDLLWSRVKITLKEPFAEFFGTAIMVFFGNGSVAQVLLSAGLQGAPGGNGYGAYNAISWGWALGVMLGIYVSGDAGGYLNPAVTFAQCLFRGLPWSRFPLYTLAQFLGGFVSSALVYGYYWYAITEYEGGASLRTVPPAPRATAGIFCTYPQSFMTTNASFWAEVVETSALMFCILALQDMTNAGTVGHVKILPLGLFFIIWGLGACFGYQTGYAMNLARDFGPRLMSYILGYGTEVFSAGDYFFWIPIVAPFVGCSFGAFVYDVFIYTGESPVNTPWLGFKRLFLIVKPRERRKVDEKYSPQTVSEVV